MKEPLLKEHFYRGIIMEKILTYSLSNTSLTIFTTIVILFIYYKVLQTKFEEFIKKFDEKISELVAQYNTLQKQILQLSKELSDLKVKVIEEYRSKEECVLISKGIKDEFVHVIEKIEKEISNIKQMLLEIIKKR